MRGGARLSWRVGTAAAGLVVGVCAAGASGSVHAAAAAPSAYQQLAGVTTVHTATSGVATLELRTAARLAGSKGFGGPFTPSTYAHGAGRIAGVVLEQGGSVLAEFFQLRDCTTAGCEDGHFTFSLLSVTNRVLQPGLYHLYVVADGAPVTAQVSLDGASGSSTVSVTPSSAIAIQALAPLLPSTGVADPGVYSASSAGAIGEQGGIMLNVMALEVQSFVAGAFGGCAAEGAPPPAYIAGCDFPPGADVLQNIFVVCDPTGFCDPGFTVDSATGQFGFFGGGIYRIAAGHAGTWGQGGYFDAPSLLTSEAATGLWLSFIPQEQAAAATAPTPAPSAAPAATPSPSPGATPSPPTLPNTSSTGGSRGAASLAVLLVAVALRRRRVSPRRTPRSPRRPGQRRW
jgi:MYXO-CTERM domain-containing protein